MKNYIVKNSKTIQKQHLELKLYNKPVNIVKAFEQPIDLSQVLSKIEARMPQYLVQNIEGIYVGDFKEFSTHGKDVNATYKDGAIYVSNKQDNEDDLLDDVVHEIAHSMENQYQDLIYGDEELEAEFLAKRRTLYFLLDRADMGLEKNLMYFLNPEYNFNFDMFLYKKLGYDYLRSASSGLFYSPYAITSLKEYWANGFENYFLGDRQKLKELSPILYNKIKALIEAAEKQGRI
jgi:hypothetical protein